MDLCSTAQANAFSLIYGPSNFDQSSPSDTRITHLRYKGVDQFNVRNPNEARFFPKLVQALLIASIVKAHTAISSSYLIRSIRPTSNLSVIQSLSTSVENNHPANDELWTTNREETHRREFESPPGDSSGH